MESLEGHIALEMVPLLQPQHLSLTIPCREVGIEIGCQLEHFIRTRYFAHVPPIQASTVEDRHTKLHTKQWVGAMLIITGGIIKTKILYLTMWSMLVTAEVFHDPILPLKVEEPNFLNKLEEGEDHNQQDM
jgi:hypothetical protein